MLPEKLQAESFASYPPEARTVAVGHVPLLRELPLAFEPLLLREVIAYDWKFPVERKELDRQLSYLQTLPEGQRHAAMAPFATLRLSPELEHVDWVNSPAQFSEQLTAHLWATHQIDSFRTAAVDYVHKVNAAYVPDPLPVKRLSIVLIGQNVGETKYALFRKLRKQGVYFGNVNPQNGRQILLDAVARRAASHPVAFGHWYIDGGRIATSAPQLTRISYASLQPVCSALVAKMRKVVNSDGPEVLRSVLARMRPEDVGLSGGDPVLDHFQISLLTEGSGTQIFSTTFVQWTAREALRRAQPLTLLARFTPRQHEQTIREILAGAEPKPAPDPQGSLVDADMGAYYTWLNQQRLSGAPQSSFLVWYEDHKEAVAVAPGLKPGTESHTPLNVEQLFKLVTDT